MQELLDGGLEELSRRRRRRGTVPGEKGIGDPLRRGSY